MAEKREKVKPCDENDFTNNSKEQSGTQAHPILQLTPNDFEQPILASGSPKEKECPTLKRTRDNETSVTETVKDQNGIHPSKLPKIESKENPAAKNEAPVEPELNNDGSHEKMNRKELLDLPNECLISILNYLNIKDLTSVASTCTRLQSVARSVFKLKPEFTCLDMLKLVKSFEPIQMDQLDHFFEIFGDLLNEISLDFHSKYNYSQLDEYQSLATPLFNLITTHCGGGNLRGLRLYQVELDSNSAEIRQLFKHLEMIDLEYFGEIPNILAESVECVHLSLTGTFSDFHISDVFFPKLKSFSCTPSDGDDTFDAEFEDELIGFIQRHHNKLTALKLLEMRPLKKLSVIGQLRNLEVLHLHMKSEVYDEEERVLGGWENLSKLRELNLYWYDLDVSNFFEKSASAESVEYLEWHFGYIGDDDHDIDGLMRFRNLRTLKFGWFGGKGEDMDDDRINQLSFHELTDLIFECPCRITENGIIRLIKNHRKLQRITLKYTDISINHDTYEKIVEVCRNQNRKLTMKWSEFLHMATLAKDINYDSHFVIENVSCVRRGSLDYLELLPPDSDESDYEEDNESAEEIY